MAGDSSQHGGHRKGVDPEGGQRSAWKGFVGPSGLNLPATRIPEIEQQVYDTLLPLVFRAEHPIPLSQFTQAACDVLLPLLPNSSEELSEHAFKSQWGRLNEFVCPKLAELRGLGDCSFNRQQKTVLLSIATDPPPGFTPTARAAAASRAGGEEEEGGRGGRRRRDRGGRRERGGQEGGEGAAEAGGAGSGQEAGGYGRGETSAMPLPLAIEAGGQRSLQQAVQGIPPDMYHAVVPQQLCMYCGQGVHVVKQCPDFNAMLQSICQAGYQQGVAAAQQAQQLPQMPQVVASPQLSYP